MATNLPIREITDSAAGTILYFDAYSEAPLEFPANDVTATVGVFEAAGFKEDAAQTSAMTLLRQAKIDGTPIAGILDTIRGFDAAQLSTLVSEILNNNRVATSTLGFKVSDVEVNQTRQILA